MELQSLKTLINVEVFQCQISIIISHAIVLKENQERNFFERFQPVSFERHLFFSSNQFRTNNQSINNIEIKQFFFSSSSSSIPLVLFPRIDQINTVRIDLINESVLFLEMSSKKYSSSKSMNLSKENRLETFESLSASYDL